MSAQSTALVAILALGAAGVYGAHIVKQIDAGKIATIQAADAKAQAAAISQAAEIQKAQDALSLKDQAAETGAQAKIVTRTVTLIQKVPTYVTPAQDARGCISWGTLRVLDAAALGVDPGTLQLPAGQSDDACSAVKASDLASSVAGNYGTASQNSEQLNALIADVKARAATVPAPQSAAAKPKAHWHLPKLKL